MDLDQSEEREHFDWVDLVLPGKKMDLISSVAKAPKTGGFGDDLW